MLNKLWAIVPAAGVGSRMGSHTPKQYLKIQNSTVLQITINKLLELTEVAGVVVAVSDTDTWYEASIDANSKVHRVNGGGTRAQSVFNALEYLHDSIGCVEWALVHDAARPCVNVANIQRLIAAVYQADCGGILASPVADTLKQVEAGVISATIDRARIWQAHTPQLFKAAELLSALTFGFSNGLTLTDEASAMESAGFSSIVVEDTRDNIKITLPEDLPLAEFILSRQ